MEIGLKHIISSPSVCVLQKNVAWTKKEEARRLTNCQGIRHLGQRGNVSGGWKKNNTKRDQLHSARWSKERRGIVDPLAPWWPSGDRRRNGNAVRDNQWTQGVFVQARAPCCSLKAIKNYKCLGAHVVTRYTRIHADHKSITDERA